MSPKKRQTRRPPARPRSARETPTGTGRPVRPLPEGETFFTPGATGMRAAVERRSSTVLVYLHQMPRWILPLLIAALMLAGLVVPGPMGALALTLVAAFLGWLAYLSWPSLTAGKRTIRVLTTVVLLALAIAQLVRF